MGIYQSHLYTKGYKSTYSHSEIREQVLAIILKLYANPIFSISLNFYTHLFHQHVFVILLWGILMSPLSKLILSDGSVGDRGRLRPIMTCSFL